MKKFHERWLESIDELEESYEIQTRKVFRRTALQFTASLLKEKNEGYDSQDFGD